MSDIAVFTTDFFRGVSVLHCSGEVDMTTAPVMGDAVDLLLDHRPSEVVIDLGSVTFLDSTGIAVLVAAAQTGVVLAVVATTHAVLRALEMTGVDALLPLYATVDEAVDGAALTPPPAPQSPTPPEPT